MIVIYYSHRVKELRGGVVGGVLSNEDLPPHKLLQEVPVCEPEEAINSSDLQYLHRSLHKVCVCVCVWSPWLPSDHQESIISPPQLDLKKEKKFN